LDCQEVSATKYDWPRLAGGGLSLQSILLPKRLCAISLTRQHWANDSLDGNLNSFFSNTPINFTKWTHQRFPPGNLKQLIITILARIVLKFLVLDSEFLRGRKEKSDRAALLNILFDLSKQKIIHMCIFCPSIH
jgi:hypothetical protein